MRFQFQPILAAILLLLLPALLAPRLSAQATEESLIAAWEAYHRKDPKTEALEKTGERTYYFKTSWFPYEGELKIVNVVLDDRRKEYGIIGGVVEVELPGVDESFLTKHQKSYSLWSQGNAFSYNRESRTWRGFADPKKRSDSDGLSMAIFMFMLSGIFPFLSILIFLLQAYCVFHVIRNQNDYWWIYLIVFIPLIGCGVYLYTSVFPDFQRHYQIESSRKGKSFRPGDISRLEKLVEQSPTINNRQDLAAAYLAGERYAEAEECYRGCLSGIYKNDPAIKYKLARTCFETQKYSESIELLDSLLELEYVDYPNERKLLRAQNVYALGQPEQALEILGKLKDSFAGEEARFRYAWMQKDQGNHAAAKAEFQKIIANRKNYHRRAIGMELKWIKQAKKELKDLR